MANDRFQDGDKVIIHTKHGDKIIITCKPDPENYGQCPLHIFDIEGADTVVHQKHTGQRYLLEPNQ